MNQDDGFMRYKTTYSCLIVAFVLSFSQASYSGEESELLTILSTAKIAGACGILDSLIDFQAKTKMNGGNEFVSRFWTLEAARLGLSVEELSNSCNTAVLRYDQYWKIVEK